MKPLTIVLTFVMLSFVSTAYSDLDKEDLKTKAEGEAQPSMGNGDDLQQLAKRGEENLREINKLLDDVQNDLSNQNTGADTQKKQQQAVQRLEKLIEEIAKASSGGGGGGSSDGQQQNKKPQSQNEKSQKKRQEQQKQQAERQKKEKSQQEQNDQQNRNDQRRDDVKPPRDKAGSLVERMRQAARWGLLPPKVTQALSSGDKEAPAEYREIIARYYKKMTDAHNRYEQSRTGGR